MRVESEGAMVRESSLNESLKRPGSSLSQDWSSELAEPFIVPLFTSVLSWEVSIMCMPCYIVVETDNDTSDWEEKKGNASESSP